jgi:hypothetical protein
MTLEYLGETHLTTQALLEVEEIGQKTEIMEA